MNCVRWARVGFRTSKDELQSSFFVRSGIRGKRYATEELGSLNGRLLSYACDTGHTMAGGFQDERCQRPGNDLTQVIRK
jgi:hypothetical protein